MGILDDAIRQHLDLKRRLGAEDDEIARLEDEAFGPPTRPGEPDFPDPGEAQALAPETGESPAQAAVAPEPPAPEPPFYDHREDAPVEDEPDVAEEQVAQVPFEMDDPASHLEVLAEPAVPLAPPQSDEAPVEPPVESLDTVEHPFEGAIGDTGEAEVIETEIVEGELDGSDEQLPEEGDEDVLEETPEFLRDQPEDDELWFEQGEPKDFDF